MREMCTSPARQLRKETDHIDEGVDNGDAQSERQQGWGRESGAHWGEGIWHTQTLRRAGNLGRVGFDTVTRSFFPWMARSPVSHPTYNVPFPPNSR